MLPDSDTTTPRNECKLTKRQLAAIVRSDKCQRLMTELEMAVLSKLQLLRPARRAKKLSTADPRTSKSGANRTVQFGWVAQTAGNTLHLRADNFDPAYMSIREPLFELNALFGGFDCAAINVGTEVAPHKNEKAFGKSLAFTLGKFQGGNLIVGIPSEKKGA